MFSSQSNQYFFESQYQNILSLSFVVYLGNCLANLHRLFSSWSTLSFHCCLTVMLTVISPEFDTLYWKLKNFKYYFGSSAHTIQSWFSQTSQPPKLCRKNIKLVKKINTLHAATWFHAPLSPCVCGVYGNSPTGTYANTQSTTLVKAFFPSDQTWVGPITAKQHVLQVVC